MTPQMVTNYSDPEDEDSSPLSGLWMWKQQFHENAGNHHDLITYSKALSTRRRRLYRQGILQFLRIRMLYQLGVRSKFVEFLLCFSCLYKER